MSKTIFATFANGTQCEQAAGALLDFGARKDDIAVIALPFETAAVTESVVLTGDFSAPGSEGSLGGETRGVLLGNAQRQYNLGAGLAVADNSFRPHERIDGLSRLETHSKYVPTDPESVCAIQSATLEAAAKNGISVTTPQDAGAGAAKGAAWGLGVGVLAGLACLTIPGVGMVIGGGALATAFAGAFAATVAGAAAGGVLGYLKDQGMPEHVAAEYHGDLQNGMAMLALAVPSGDVDSDRAAATMRKYGAFRVDAY